MPSRLSPPDAAAEGRRIAETLQQAGIYGDRAGGYPGVWRIALEPYWLAPHEAAALEDLGPRLLAFYRSLNRLYYHSAKTPSLAWVQRYLDQGKPPAVIDYGMMRRFRDRFPGIIRPDLFFTGSGMIASELDAVPGGFGLTAALQATYGERADLVGGRDGIVRGFMAMIASTVAGHRVAIVVSDESADYRPEMRWLADAVHAAGMPCWAVQPSDIVFSETGLEVRTPAGRESIDAVYRFFELFDLKNIPKAELILYAVKKGLVAMTPPVKAFLEEKSAMALWHHPVLNRWWRDDLGEETHRVLSDVFPRTWILDPSPVPPHAVIAGLTSNGVPLQNFRDLGSASQRERRLVIKPSGFSARAWGSRGVVVGHDHASETWVQALDDALAAFPLSPHVLQAFHSARHDDIVYWDEAAGVARVFRGRTRICPYYFVAGDDVRLGGVLATICALDKKLIHGMTDAVLAPCAVRPA